MGLLGPPSAPLPLDQARERAEDLLLHEEELTVFECVCVLTGRGGFNRG